VSMRGAIRNRPLSFCRMASLSDMEECRYLIARVSSWTLISASIPLALLAIGAILPDPEGFPAPGELVVGVAMGFAAMVLSILGYRLRPPATRS
jgi:hypothetical protein